MQINKENILFKKKHLFVLYDSVEETKNPKWEEREREREKEERDRARRERERGERERARKKSEESAR